MFGHFDGLAAESNFAAFSVLASLKFHRLAAKENLRPDQPLLRLDRMRRQSLQRPSELRQVTWIKLGTLQIVTKEITWPAV